MRHETSVLRRYSAAFNLGCGWTRTPWYCRGKCNSPSYLKDIAFFKPALVGMPGVVDGDVLGFPRHELRRNIDGGGAIVARRSRD